MPKRLSEKQKEQITLGFTEGKTIEFLSEEFDCSKLTINRNLKKNLGELKFKELFNKSKSLKEKSKKNQNQTNVLLEKNLDNEDLNDPKILNKNISASSLASNDYFLEIAPTDYEINDSSRKELSSVPISEVDFPKVVYMTVDKKIELEIKLLKDFPEWEFLTNDDLNRKTIEIFFDLNLAKRSCNKEQKVIKVPNTDVFRIASPILISRGISRIVCADNLIAL